MTTKFKSANILYLLVLVVSLSACNEWDSDLTRKFDIPSDLSISDSNFYPEDIVANHNMVYVSGFGDGSIKSFDLTSESPTALDFAPAEDGYAQRWGLTSHKNVLLSIANNANFMGGENGPSKLIEYDIEDGSKTGEWDLPSSTIGHTVSVVDGKYYIGDFANPRIIEVDPETGEVDEDWFTSSQWDPSIDGNLGGIVYDKKGGFYAYLGFKIWYLPIKNGEPGEMEEVSISGLDPEQINVDGISWDKRRRILYYASNDAMDPSKAGAVYKLEFSDKTTAEGSVVVSGLDDSSGLWYNKTRDGEFLMVCESQFGALFGLKDLDGSFNVKVVELP